MKILHVLDHSLPLHSGYSFRTVAILREQRARGWQTVQMTTPRQGRSMADVEQVDGWEFHRTWPVRTPRSLIPIVGAYLDEMSATRTRLMELAAIHRPNVIHAHSPVLNALPALSVGRELGIPVVYEVRASWEDAAVDHGTTSAGSIRYRVTRGLETYAVKRAQRVAVICEGLRRDLEARGVAKERITVIPNAVDADQFPFNAPPDAKLRSELGLEGRIVVGFLGSFYAYEGLDLLLDAFARLLPERPQLRLLLGGGGPQEATLKNRAAQLGIEDKVLLIGRVPHEDVGRYYSLVDVLAYPRRSMRLTDLVTPLKPLEGMALGKIVVASDVGGHRELIDDGQTGYLFSASGGATALSDRLREVLLSRDQWPEIRSKARHFIESERSWTKSVARYTRLYETVSGIDLSPGVSTLDERASVSSQ